MNWMSEYVRFISKKISPYQKQPVWEATDYPWDSRIRDAFPIIQKEFFHARQYGGYLRPIQEISKEQIDLTQDERWKVFFLVGYNYTNPRARSFFPKTLSLVQSIPNLVSAFFSVLEAGKSLPPHYGKFNGILRYHLGISIPEPASCGLRVGEETLQWKEGESILFDDTYQHEAWNNGSKDRVVLILDLQRPLPFPLNVANKLAIQIIRQSPYVKDAKKKL